MPIQHMLCMSSVWRSSFERKRLTDLPGVSMAFRRTTTAVVPDLTAFHTETRAPHRAPGPGGRQPDELTTTPELRPVASETWRELIKRVWLVLRSEGSLR
ncbi:MAG: hypothetical protein NTV49_09070 [Kiritimatiellaeota bacterium]|nr:hypothetical protein [Kiritimatiellota bacterium]